MNNELDREDQDWFDALAGRPKSGMNALDAAQALAVRTALSERRNAIEADASQPDAAQLNRLRQRLVREGLMETATANSTHSGLLGRILGIFGASGRGGSMAIPLLGVAAALVIVVAAVIQISTPSNVQNPAYDVLRGGTATVLIVDDPQARLTELQAGLRGVKANFEVKQLEGNRLQVDIKVDEPALAYLEAQRISPTVKDGIVRILIQRPAAKP
ncbi:MULTISPECIES: hypothetical protein [unclassified Polaromonas]|uniref:hypothetical protein n=1 Tax=unclassified Polaromonas TaxID=2638319 RepID=UPI0018C9050D|nr:MULTISPECIES: hypothetical protein [unclassified Polaromonas]MBG6073425.1 hypothetical protein [Polaromonas sp. CG_9.7]MBG6115390.1 hypothetical protein [Polaromonas sp. CG_9.2]